MARLPQPGSDQGTWGAILNEFLTESLAADGSLKANTVGPTQIADGSLPQAKITGLSTALSTITTDVSNVSDDVTDIAADVNTLSGNYTTLSGSVTSLENEQSTLSDDVAAVETALSAKADLVGGLVPASQLPDSVKTRAVTVADQAAMLALSSSAVQPGDIAVRTDGAGSFILTAADPSILGNWLLMNAPRNGDLSGSTQLGSISGTLNLSGYATTTTVHATLTGAITTVSLPTPAGLSYTITTVLTQDATGGRTLATPVGTKRDSQLDPVLSTGAGLTDMLHWFCDGVAWWVIVGSRSA